MSILNELWNGNIAPIERNPRKSQRYRELSQKIEAAESKFFSRSSKKQQDLYKKCVALMLEREGISEEEIFSEGFSMGAQMMLEILKSSHNF